MAVILGRMFKSPHLLTALIALSCTSAAYALPGFETEVQIGVVSDYRWRGVSLSDEDPSLQGEITASHESGVWLWGGANTVSSDLGGSELNLAIGYDRAFAGFAWSVAAVRYIYLGEADIDYTEFDLSATRELGPIALTVGVEYAPEQDNYDEDDTYVFVGFEATAPHEITVHGHVGQDDGVMAIEPRAIDYSLGVSRPFGPLQANITFVEAEGADSAFIVGFAFIL